MDWKMLVGVGGSGGNERSIKNIIRVIIRSHFETAVINGNMKLISMIKV